MAELERRPRAPARGWSERWTVVLPVVRRAAIVILLIVAVDGAYQAFGLIGFDPLRENGDGWNYLAAGERLNASHPLYTLSPGDRPVLIVPPYWTVPLLAPPPIAVVFRPIAAVGPAAVDAWALLILVATAGAAIYLAAGSLVGLSVVAVLSAPLALLAFSGNVNGLVLVALVLAWRLRDRPVIMGSLVAFTIAMKLTPILLVIWLLAARRLRALVAMTLALVAIGLVSMIGAGLGNHLDWLRSVPASQPSPLSLSTLLGLSPTILLVAAAVIVVGVATRRIEALTFAAAVVASALVTPAFYFQAIGLLAAAVAPWAAGRLRAPAGLGLRGGRPNRRPAT